MQVCQPHRESPAKYLTKKQERLRRIRCDEGFPICQQCIKINRECTRGPSTPEKALFKFKAPLTTLHFQPSNTLSGLTKADIPYLDAFRYRLIDDLVGAHTRPAWRGLLLHAVQTEPAFRHAAVAFAAACGLVDGAEWSADSYDMGGLPVPAPSKTRALRHYDACLQGVRRLIARDGTAHVNTTLFCALLCICFELRIGMPHIALRHLEHSLAIIDADAAHGTLSWVGRVYGTLMNCGVVNDDLSLAFAKLDIQASMFISSRTPKTDMHALSRLSLDGSGENPHTDRALACLLGRVFNFLCSNPGVFRSISGENWTHTIFEELVVLRNDLGHFRASHSVTGVPDLTVTKTLPQTLQTVWITALILEVILSTCLTGDDEMIYDTFLPHFEAITVMAEGILRSAGKYAGGYKDFRLDVALVYPLYMTGQLCRHPGIRRRVLRLTENISFDEGVWDGSSGEKYVKILMRLEERGLALDESDLDSYGPAVVPGKNRVRALDIQPAEAERYSSMFFRFNRRSGRWDDLVEKVVW